MRRDAMLKRKYLLMLIACIASVSLLIGGCTVGSNYNVENAEEPRDIALSYLRNQAGDEAPPANINWKGKDISPFGQAGSVTVEFTSEDWKVMISFSSDPPETREYQVEVTNQKADRHWELKVLPDKTVEEVSTGDS
jgi:hypothetical protein